MNVSAATTMQAHRPIRILVVDSHPIVIAGCKATLASDDIEVAAANDGTSGFEAYVGHKPEIVIMEIDLPGLSGFELLRRLLKSDPQARVILYSSTREAALVRRAIELGAKGYVCKQDDADSLVHAVREVSQGRSYMSADLDQAMRQAGAKLAPNALSQMSLREVEIMRLLARGRKIVEIADALDISYKTVANTTSLLKQKLGARSHSDLIRLAVEFGLDASNGRPASAYG